MGRNLFEYHPRIGYRFIPGIRARVRHESGGYLVRCNAAGFRCDHEVTPKKPDGVFRIILSGDSYTAGEGVSNGQRYGDLLESRFPHTQLLNFALPGTGTDQQYLAFCEYAAELEYDLLVISPMVENIRRITSTHRITMNSTDGELVRRAKPYYTLEGDKLTLHHWPVPKQVEPVQAPPADGAGNRGALGRLLRRLDGRMPGLLALSQRLRGIRDPIEYENPADPAWRLMKRILQAWIDRATAPVILCPIPTFSHINRGFGWSNIHSRFAELASDRVQLVDLLPAFWNLPAAERKQCKFPIDEHPSPRGHQVIANALASYVEPHHARTLSA